jgi:hypothetical protein
MEEEKVQIEELSENAILIQNACKERYTPHTHHSVPRVFFALFVNKRFKYRPFIS